MPTSSRRIDPALGLSTPILFAHRGGAKEEPESTIRAFEAAKTKAQVLEVDVQVTKNDEAPVVWHGPELDNVEINGKTANAREKNHIGDFSWKELDGKAFVAEPSGQQTLSFPRTPETRILRFEEFLQSFPNQHLNVEMKKDTFKKRHVKGFLRLLDQYKGKRKIIVVSQSRTLLELFRQESQESYPTGLSTWEAIGAFFGAILPGISLCDMTNRALQTVHVRSLTPPKLIRQVREKGGSLHVFLNAPKRWAIDAEPNQPNQQQIDEMLDRGVDGIMTDRPSHVRLLIDDWLRRNP